MATESGVEMGAKVGLGVGEPAAPKNGATKAGRVSLGLGRSVDLGLDVGITVAVTSGVAPAGVTEVSSGAGSSLVPQAKTSSIPNPAARKSLVVVLLRAMSETTVATTLSYRDKTRQGETMRLRIIWGGLL